MGEECNGASCVPEPYVNDVPPFFFPYSIFHGHFRFSELVEALKTCGRGTGESLLSLVFVSRTPVEIASHLLAVGIEKPQFDEMYRTYLFWELNFQDIIRDPVCRQIYGGGSAPDFSGIQVPYFSEYVETTILFWIVVDNRNSVLEIVELWM